MHRGDKLLARRILAGDEAAFDRFFEEHFPALYRFALVRVAGDHDCAEEMAQGTLFKAMSRLGSYRGEASLFTWLCTFCRHEISAMYRSRQRSPRLEELIEDAPEVRSALESLAASLEEAPESALLRAEVTRLVQAVLDSLPARYGDALEWKYLEETPVIEIAARLGTTPKAAESLLTRARVAFRREFVAMAEAVSARAGALEGPIRS